MTRKIAVIGSNSFSGSDFIDLIAEDKSFQVIGISRSEEKSKLFLPYKRHENRKYKFFQLDLNKDMKDILKLLDNFAPDYIINFAGLVEVATSWLYPDQWFITHTLSTVRLCHYLAGVKYLKRYIHISTPEVYGSCDGINEDAPLNPSTPYAVSKAAADLYIQTLVKHYSFPAILVRSTNVYGAHQQLYRIIPKTIVSLKLNKKIKLHGGGIAKKSFIHIRDISKGELLALERGKIGQIYHFSPDQAIEVRRVVAMICTKMGKDFKKVTRNVAERLGQDAIYAIDSTKARKTLGWKPKITLADGIDNVTDWINYNWQEIKKLPLEYIHKA